MRHDLAIEIYSGRRWHPRRDREGSATAQKDTHDSCIARFNKLDAEIAEPNNAAPALPVAGGELEFVRDRYEVIVRQKYDLAMAFADFFCKSDPDSDSD